MIGKGERRPVREIVRGQDRLTGVRFTLAALAAVAAVAALPGCRRGAASGELHVVWSSDVLSLDPNEQFEFATDTISMNLFEPLLRYDRKLAFIPVLADSWRNGDGRTWTFHLNPRATFHDGSPVTAEDVVYTIERVRRSPGSDLFPYLSALTSVRSLDAATVEVVSDRPAGLLQVMSYVYVLPKKLIDARGEREFFENPVGSGPYRFAGKVPHQSVTLEAFPGHRSGPPRFRRAVFLRVTDTEVAWSTARDHAPALLLSPSRETWSKRGRDRDFRLISRPGMTVQYLVCNLDPARSPATADWRVRQAIRAAIDIRKLTENAYGGQAFAATQFVTPDIFGFDASIPGPAFEPGKARRLLADAGYGDGLDLTLHFAGKPGRLVEELVSQAAATGIRLKPVSLSDGEFRRRLFRCDGDLHLNGWFCSTGDASELFEGNFTSAAQRGNGQSAPSCRFASPEVDWAVDLAARTLDPSERRDVLRQAMRFVLEDLPWIPLVIPYDRYALTRGLEWSPRADGEVYLPDVRGD